MPQVEGYENAYYAMTWLGPKGYPEDANAGRCYFTGLLGMYRFNGEDDILFADGTSGDGFSFRWWSRWGRAVRSQRWCRCSSRGCGGALAPCR